MSFTVYLSGPIAGLTYEEANEWRVHVADRFAAAGIGTLNPLRRRMFVGTAGPDAEDFEPNEIVARDVGDVRRSDLLLVRWPYLSIGTACEVWEAKRLDKPIIVVSESQAIITHPWVRYAASRFFSDLDAACKYICVRWADMDPEGLPEMWS